MYDKFEERGYTQKGQEKCLCGRSIYIIGHLARFIMQYRMQWSKVKEVLI